MFKYKKGFNVVHTGTKKVDTEAESVSSHSSVDDMTDAELKDDLYMRLQKKYPVNVAGKAPSMEDIRVMCGMYKNAPVANEDWMRTAPRVVVTRLLGFLSLGLLTYIVYLGLNIVLLQN